MTSPATRHLPLSCFQKPGLCAGGSLFAVFLVLFFVNHLLWSVSFKNMQPFREKTTSVAQEILQGHLRFEEWIGKDTSVEIGTFWKNLEKAEEGVHDLITDRKKNASYGILGPVALNGELADHLDHIQLNMQKIRELANFRIKNPEISGVGSYYDTLFDAEINRLLQNLQQCEMVFSQVSTNIQKAQRDNFIFLAALAVLIFSLAAAYYFSNDKKRRLVELELLYSEERLKILSELAFEGLLVVKDGRIEDANVPATQILGYGKEELLGKEIVDLALPEDRDIISRGLSSGREEILEVTGEKRDRSHVPLEVHIKKIHYGDREISIAAVQDIAQRKLREIKQMEGSRRLTAVFENLEEAVFVAGMENHEIFYANRYLKHRLGEIEGRRCHEIFCGKKEGPCDFCRDLRLVNHEGKPTGVYVWEVKRDVDGTWHEIHARAIPWVDGHLARLQIAYDITERKKREVALEEAKQKAEEATKTKDKYVALMAHDIKAPFAAMLGLLHLMQKEGGDTLIPRHVDILKRVNTRGKELMDFCDELLRISRFKAGNILPLPSFFRVDAVVADVCFNLRPMAEGKGVALKSRAPPAMRLYGDRKLYMHVLENLLTNAIKFSQSGGRVTIFSPRAKPTTLAVRDTGIGMEEGKMQNVFKYEEPTSTRGTAGERGTGLGLPWCRDLMAAMNGSLVCESRKEEGSVFFITLPERRPLVLLVEDDGEMRSVLGEILSRMDIDVQESGSGSCAWRQLQSGERLPDMIISDLKMPGMGGIKLLEALRAEPSMKHIPFVALTADSKAETRDKILRFQATDFISKPFFMEDFSARVRKYVG